MLNNFFNHKKGESLVEVMVSISIILMAFSAAVQLVVKSMELNLASRQRTEAIYKIQETKNNFIASNVLDVCRTSAAPLLTAGLKSQSPGGCKADVNLVLSNECYYVELSDINGAEVKPAVGMNTANFIKVITYGRWKVGNKIENFSVSEIVGR